MLTECIGKFYIDKRVIIDDPGYARQILRDIIIYRAEYLLHRDQIEYIGVHSSFALVSLGQDVPEYTITIERGARKIKPFDTAAFKEEALPKPTPKRKPHFDDDDDDDDEDEDVMPKRTPKRRPGVGMVAPAPKVPTCDCDETDCGHKKPANVHAVEPAPEPLDKLKGSPPDYFKITRDCASRG